MSMMEDLDPDRAASIAQFKADMVAWHERHERARKMAAAFWKHYKRNDNGVPLPRHPSSSYFKPYYDGGHRMVIDGVPIRVAAHVADWTARARGMLGRGSQTAKEAAAIEAQMPKLFPGYVPAKMRGAASCTHCKAEYHAGKDAEPPCYRRHLARWDQQAQEMAAAE